MKEGGPAHHTDQLHFGEHPQQPVMPFLFAFNSEIIEGFWLVNQLLWRLLLTLPESEAWKSIPGHLCYCTRILCWCLCHWYSCGNAQWQPQALKHESRMFIWEMVLHGKDSCG